MMTTQCYDVLAREGYHVVSVQATSQKDALEQFMSMLCGVATLQTEGTEPVAWMGDRVWVARPRES